MQKNDILKTKDGVFRILKIDGDRVLAIDCQKRTMPKFYSAELFDNAETVDNSIVVRRSDFDDFSPKERSIAQQRFSMIASAVAVVDDEKKRNEMIRHFRTMVGYKTMIFYLWRTFYFIDVGKYYFSHLLSPVKINYN